MEQDAPRPEGFRFRDPRQERIHRWLLLIGAGPAGFFRDACRMMEGDTPLASSSHLVGHLLREMEGALCSVLEGISGEPEKRGAAQAPRGEQPAHKDKIRRILRALEIPESDPVAQTWLRLAGRYGLHARAHRDSLRAPRPVGTEFRRFWNDIQAVLDLVLDRFESRFLAVMPLLEGLLAKESPTLADAGALKNNVPNNFMTFSYFFDKLASPAWLDPLRSEGFFDHPPTPQRDEEQGTLVFPPWPLTAYLVRMAEKEPEKVVEIAITIPATENVWVHEDLADLALAIPADLAARLVPKIETWLSQPLHFGLPQKLGQLLAQLAQGGQVDRAFDLAKSLLAVLPDPREAEGAGAKTRRLVPEPRARFDLYEYEQIVRSHVPHLVTAAGPQALEMLCDLLDKAVSLSMRHLEAGQAEHHSYIWCRAVEKGKADHARDLECLLVAAVRDAAEQLVSSGALTVAEVVRVFQKRPWHIFQRLTFHILRTCLDAAIEVAAEILTDRERFDDFRLEPEYSLFAEACFRHLNEDGQKTILGWIDEGPDIQAHVEREERFSGQRPCDEEVREYAEHWMLKKLRPLRDTLPPHWRQRYDVLVQQHGEPRFPPYNIESSSVSWGRPSPASADELRAMSISELVSFLRTWQPSDDPLGPSPDGLASAMHEVIVSDPERFAKQAELFGGLDPGYVNTLLSALKNTVKKKWDALWWAPVLALCRRLVQASQAFLTGIEARPADMPTWTWTRRTIAELVSAGLDDGPEQIPFEHRDLIREVISPLTNDPDPTPSDDARNADAVMDPWTRSINTARGVAMHSVIRYALWVRRHLERTTDLDEFTARGFDEMPEVRDVLDTHLNTRTDPSPSVRAVYGRWFPWLCLLDERWATENTASIFPTDDNQLELWRAAWSGYVVSCTPYDGVFRSLKGEYDRAIDLLTEPAKDTPLSGDPAQKLAEHLMVYYWRGVLEETEQHELLDRFFSNAAETVRCHAIEFVGRCLREDERTIGSVILGRLQALWQDRVTSLQEVVPQDRRRQELAAFGWWFVSGKFDQAWALDRLKETLSISGWVEPDHLVVEHLAKVADSMPLRTVECLALLVEGDKRGWGIQHWREHARSILSAALSSGDAAAQQAARELVNRLSARGFLYFRDLLS